MTDRHRLRPITFRPGAQDYAWLLAYAQATGQPLRRVLAQALTEFRERHQDGGDPSA